MFNPIMSEKPKTIREIPLDKMPDLLHLAEQNTKVNPLYFNIRTTLKDWRRDKDGDMAKADTTGELKGYNRAFIDSLKRGGRYELYIKYERFGELWMVADPEVDGVHRMEQRPSHRGGSTKVYLFDKTVGDFVWFAESIAPEDVHFSKNIGKYLAFAEIVAYLKNNK